MTSEVVGREQELAAVAAFLDEAGELPAALVLEGEAGIGKSTLWRAGVEHARERGILVPARDRRQVVAGQCAQAHARAA